MRHLTFYYKFFFCQIIIRKLTNHHKQKKPYTCRLCEATTKDGTKLHVDYIIPVSLAEKQLCLIYNLYVNYAMLEKVIIQNVIFKTI